MGLRPVDLRNQTLFKIWQRYRLKVLRSSVGFIQPALCHHCIIIIFFSFIFSSMTDGFFNLSCDHFSFPSHSKQISSFTKIIFIGFLDLKIRRGKKLISPPLSLFRSRQILDYVCRPIKCSLKFSLHLM